MVVLDKYRAGDWHKWEIDREYNLSIVSSFTDKCHGDAGILGLIKLS